VIHSDMIWQAIFICLLLLHPSSSQRDDGRERLEDSINNLSQKMYNTLAAEGTTENFVFSPLSLHEALSILYFGATEGSETQKELIEVLSGLSSKELLEDKYTRLTKFFKRQSSIKVGNAVWLQKSLNLNRNFTELVDRTLGATTENVDFTNAETTKKVNQWVKDATNNLIPTLVDGLDPQTLIFIANALYFKDKWLYPFQEMHLDGSSLEDIHFNLESATGSENKKVKAPMMLSKSEDIGFGYILDNNNNSVAEVIHIPYISGRFRMKIIVPDNTTSQTPLKDLEKKMTTDNVFRMKFKNEWPENVRVIMPKFKISSEMELSDWLKSTGVSKIFDGAQLGNMLNGTNPAQLAVNKILQKSVIIVDKEGTEGASATGVGIVLLSGSFGRRVEITLDRPFIFVVEDNTYKVPVLVGRVKNPEPAPQ